MKRVYSVMKFILRDSAKPVAIYYLVLVTILAAMLSLLPFLGKEVGPLNGGDGTALIFLFVVGLNMFKSNYQFMQANGVTRMHFYAGGLLAMAAVAAFMAVAGVGIQAMILQVSAHGMQTISELLYPANGFLAHFLWELAAHLAAIALGWFVTMLFYRSGTALKLAISIGVPVFAIIGPPILDVFTDGWFSDAILRFCAFVLGLSGRPDAWAGALGLFVTVVAFSGFCFLLVRRAPVKT